MAGTGDDLSRWIAAAVAVVFSFACSLMVSLMSRAGDWALCDESTLDPARACFEGSAGAHALVLFSGWTSAGLAGLTALLAFAYAVRGRGGERELLIAGASSISLGVICALVGSV